MLGPMSAATGSIGAVTETRQGAWPGKSKSLSGFIHAICSSFIATLRPMLPARRRSEINRFAVEEVDPVPPSVCIVPVRMMEAWFLFSEQAIREASGNPGGRESLRLPRVQDIEGVPDPKEILHALLRDASGLSGRKLKHFRAAAAIHRMAEILDDFSPLLVLPAFQELDRDVRSATQLLR